MLIHVCSAVFIHIQDNAQCTLRKQKNRHTNPQTQKLGILASIESVSFQIGSAAPSHGRDVARAGRRSLTSRIVLHARNRAGVLWAPSASRARGKRRPWERTRSRRQVLGAGSPTDCEAGGDTGGMGVREREGCVSVGRELEGRAVI